MAHPETLQGLGVCVCVCVCVCESVWCVFENNCLKNSCVQVAPRMTGPLSHHMHIRVPPNNTFSFFDDVRWEYSEDVHCMSVNHTLLFERVVVLFFLKTGPACVVMIYYLLSIINYSTTCQCFVTVLKDNDIQLLGNY